MVLAGFIIAQMVIAAEKVRCMSAARAFQTPSNGSSRWLTVIFLLCYNTDIKGARYGGDKEKVLGKGSDTHQ